MSDTSQPAARPADGRHRHAWLDQLIVAAVFGAIGLAALALFVRVAEGPERSPRPAAGALPDLAPLVTALSPDAFSRRLAAVEAAGISGGAAAPVGRFTGTPGAAATAALAERCFREAGLEVMRQPFRVTAPVTETCSVTDTNGVPLPNVRIHPFGPAGLLPVALPPEGLRCRLAVTEGTDLHHLNGLAVTNTVVVTTVDSARAWPTLASVGVRGLIVREDALSASLTGDPDLPQPWRELEAPGEHTFPRWVATGPIDSHDGQDVLIRCRTAWREQTASNIVGVLRGASGHASEALVLSAFYDSNSFVPDLAPGAEQALSITTLMELARALAPYRGQLRRDVIFVATAAHSQSLTGVSRLLEAFDTISRNRSDFQTLEARRDDARNRAAWAEAAATLSPAAAAGSHESADWFEEQVRIVAGDICLARREQTLAARLAYLRAGSPVYRDGFDPVTATAAERGNDAHTHPLLAAYLQAKRAEDQAANLLSMPLATLLAAPPFLEGGGPAAAAERFGQLAAQHHREANEASDAIAIRELFARYRSTLTLNIELYSGGQAGKRDLAVLVGQARPGTVVEPQVNDLARLLQTHADAGSAPFKVVQWGSRDAAGSPERPNTISPSFPELESEAWFRAGRLAFTITNHDFFPGRAITPEDTFNRLPTRSPAPAVAAIGRAALAVACGEVAFKPVPAESGRWVMAATGRAVCHVGTATVVPSHPLTHRTFVRIGQDNMKRLSLDRMRGVQLPCILATDLYGRFREPLAFTLTWRVDFDAATFDEHGRPIYFRDAAPAVQAVSRCAGIADSDLRAGATSGLRPVNVPMFRATPVMLTQRGNPQTMKTFVRTLFLDRLGLGEPPHVYSAPLVTFLEPDFRFFVGMLDGAPDNPQIQVYRAFMLNNESTEPAPGEADIAGAGFLAADTPVITWPHAAAATSLARTAEKRLGLQRRFGMADTQMLSFHRQALAWLQEFRRRLDAGQIAEAAEAAGTSLSYATNNHPVIRSRITHAVTGILWYLGLLVPFVFFFEKLVFGFSDIRRQLLACGAIFLCFFGLLRLLHPAFELVRSSLVILLGFVILFLTVLVTLMVGGKFRQNLRELRRHEGRVEGADVNRGGVIGTAFMLGLNNMRRRKVRTALTSIALILITFVLICFTSVSSSLQNEEYSVGRSPWNGLFIRNENYAGLEPGEVDYLRQLYGRRYPVAVYRWLVGNLSIWGGATPGIQNAQITLDAEAEEAGTRVVRRAQVSAALVWPDTEPLFSGADRLLLTNRGWFPPPPRTRAERVAAMAEGRRTRSLIMLPDTVAAQLGIRVEDVNSGEPAVVVRGERFVVHGIIDSAGLSALTGPDGRSLLPYDLNSVQNMGRSGGRYLVPEDAGRLSPAQVVIANRMPPVRSGSDEDLTVAAGVLLPSRPYRLAAGEPEQPAVDYRTQRQVIQEYLERTGRRAYYAADGIAYHGSRRRARSLAGMLELLVPVLLAAMTVFNTMRGSVYERRSEIYVYNAVGIAPNHVFFIFMAEALVYAVVGAMFGYLLSQGTGRVLTALGWTGGMNMDYSSIETIFASLAIMLAVLISTVVPARDAARLASPTGNPDQAVPRPDLDTLEFALPFTFTAHDRLAVISYFHRWLDAHGAGSSGPFFCGPPAVRLEDAADGPVPSLSSVVWLKPYDLGVSQRVAIALPRDPDTGEYVARIRIERLSGQVSAWQRTLRPFLKTVRKQFLNWRVATAADRRELFGEARTLLERSLS